MEPIGEFLKKFKRPSIETRECFINIVKEVCKIELKVEQIHYKNGIVFIEAPVIIKSQIALYSDEIIKKLQESGVKERVDRIR